MIKEDLSIIINTVDYSEILNDFLDESVALVVPSSDPIYVGLYKPFNQLYIYMDTPSSTKVTYTVEYYNGTSWVPTLLTTDDTKRLTRSGYICWQEADSNTQIEQIEVEGITKYFYRVTPSSELTISLKGINIIFSQDRDIYMTRPILDDVDYKRAVVNNDTNYMRVHLDVVDEMIQELRNLGITKHQGIDDPNRSKFIKNITKWDLFDIDEIKQSCKNLALAKIYYALSDSADDKWETEAIRFKEEYYRTLDIAFISIDTNNDGELDDNETLRPIKTSTMGR